MRSRLIPHKCVLLFKSIWENYLLFDFDAVHIQWNSKYSLQLVFFDWIKPKPWKEVMRYKERKKGKLPLIFREWNETKRDLICSWMEEIIIRPKRPTTAHKWHNATTHVPQSLLCSNGLCDDNNRLPNSNILTHAMSSLISFFLSLAVFRDSENTLAQPHNCIEPVDYWWFTMNHFYFSWPLKCNL